MHHDCLKRHFGPGDGPPTRVEELAMELRERADAKTNAALDALDALATENKELRKVLEDITGREVAPEVQSYRERIDDFAKEEHPDV